MSLSWRFHRRTALPSERAHLEFKMADAVRTRLVRGDGIGGSRRLAIGFFFGCTNDVCVESRVGGFFVLFFVSIFFLIFFYVRCVGSAACSCAYFRLLVFSHFVIHFFYFIFLLLGGYFRV